MKTNGTRTASIAVAVTGAILALGACGGSSGQSGMPGGTGGSAAGTKTVTTEMIQGVGSVLVDAKGDALYFNDQEAKGGKVLCTGDCTSIWPPLVLPARATGPSAAAGLGGKLGVVRRPDGKRQVTWGGKPLYSFAEDGGPGKVTGNGTSDSFGGTSFSWHVSATGAATGTDRSQTSTQQNGAYGY